MLLLTLIDFLDSYTWNSNFKTRNSNFRILNIKSVKWLHLNEMPLSMI